MSSDDYESIDSPRVASLSDLARIPSQRSQSSYTTDEDDEDITPTPSSSNSATKNVMLAPLQSMFLQPASDNSDIEEPRVQLREKKKAARAQDATVSHFLDEAPGQKFKRRSAERHSMLAGAADFASRRSPFHLSGAGSGRWTDLFSSNRFKRKTRQKIHNGPTSSSAAANDDYGTYGGTRSIGGMSIASNSSGETYIDSCTEEQLREEFRSIMLEKNLPAGKVDEIVAATPMQQMKQMITNARKTDNKQMPPEWSIHALEKILKTENILDCKKEIVTVSIQLKCQSVSLLYQIADSIRGESGRTGIDLICRLYSLVLKRLRNSEVGSKLEFDLIDFLQEVVRCIRTIVNTHLGLELVFRRNSPVCSLLIQTMCILNRREYSDNEPNEIRLLRDNVVKIGGSLMLVSHETLSNRTIEMTGQQKMFMELSTIAKSESKRLGKCVSRFQPLVSCIKFVETRDPKSTMLVLLMLNMLINGVDRNTSDDQMWTEETMWQARMRLRSEAARDNLSKYIEKFTSSENVDSKVKEVAQNMLSEHTADLETLYGKLDNVKAEYDTLDGCFELLAANSEATGTETILLSILQLLTLTHEDMSTKRAYMKLIESSISEIIFHRTPIDPDSQDKLVFEIPVSEIIERMQDEEMAKKLRQATSAKQEAVAMQGEYWKKLCEFQKESEALRKHISDPKVALPPPTKMTLSAPSTSSGSSSLPPITGGPPPPPGLPPVTGGPPPPPPPGGLPPITGGPPPPPPPGGLPPIRGGPPPPPPPPGAGPPPPPPPPPPGGFKGGPPPPPPPGMFAPMVPTLPDYLPPKKIPKVDGPMRKFPWGAHTINPRDIPRESFWTRPGEDDYLENKDVYKRLRAKFATKPAAGVGVAGGKLESKKKIKTAQVIQDDKLLQKLGILQGSIKMSHSDLKSALLEVNEKVLTIGFLEQLRAAMPAEKDLIDKLRAVEKAQFDEMPEGEQFITHLLQIQGLPLRLDLILFKMRFSETLDELKPAMSSVMEACEEVRTSKGFRKFLNLVLATGNFMGGATKNYSNAYAFDMKMLTRLVDTKDVDNRHTLLQHLIQEMRRVFPDSARFGITDFHHCIESSRVNADEIRKTVQLTGNNLKKLENCLKVYKVQGEKDRFAEKMDPFLKKAIVEFATVSTMSEKMKSDWESVVKYYAFNEKKYPMEEFFADIRTFSEQYTAAWKELDAEAEAANAEAKRKEVAMETQKRKQQQQAQKQRVPLQEKQMINRMPRTPAAMIRVSTAADKVGVLDELERATGNDAFLQTLMSATNSRTPRSGMPSRTRGGGRLGGAGLDRQRSRHQNPYNDLGEREPVLSGQFPRSARNILQNDQQQNGGLSEAVKPTTALDRAKAFGVGLPIGQNELKVRVRRKGQPAVPVANINGSSQISPTHKENDPTGSASSSSKTESTSSTITSNSSSSNTVVPSTDDLLARLHDF
ncbi:CBN-CYK-1 protein [Caenorhabditis brenneri]|uniref:CBN-CYK-1 protein n=1 Tax=Caenorhabditis brenneri TaxID=135651 RepID=G0MEQ9_CAEBE|nr:CBN-CYK-1 protein [Caenorhabditis brenneri]